MHFFDLINHRKSTRQFDQAKKISQNDLDQLLNAISLAPSAGNLQSYHIFVIESTQNKQQLQNICYNQRSPFIAQANVVLVFCSDLDHSAAKYEDRGRQLYAIQDATIAASYAQLAATELGYSSCWVGSFDENKVKELLNIQLKPIALIPIGFNNQQIDRPARRPLSEMVTHL